MVPVPFGSKTDFFSLPLKNILLLWKYLKFAYFKGGPVVPSGNMSSPTASASVSAASSHHMVPAVGYTTTGKIFKLM